MQNHKSDDQVNYLANEVTYMNIENIIWELLGNWTPRDKKLLTNLNRWILGWIILYKTNSSNDLETLQSDQL
jgi:glycosylphosphatidylinositol transamidase (GPIT) subunit GPI8